MVIDISLKLRIFQLVFVLVAFFVLVCPLVAYTLGRFCFLSITLGSHHRF